MLLEEKKAIERLNAIDETVEEYDGNILKADIEIIMDLITKLQKEIEHQQEKRENQKAELEILNEKQKDMNKLINDVKTYKGQFKRQEKEIREKNKQIDLMAGYINYLSDELVRLTGENKLKFCDMETCLIDVYCEDCIKKYFEKLSKEKGE